MRWEGVDRKWPGTPPGRKGRKNHSFLSATRDCEVVSRSRSLTKSGLLRHVDHIVPARPRPRRRLRAGNQTARKTGMHLRDLPGVQASDGPQVVPGDRETTPDFAMLHSTAHASGITKRLP